MFRCLFEKIQYFQNQNFQLINKKVIQQYNFSSTVTITSFSVIVNIAELNPTLLKSFPKLFHNSFFSGTFLVLNLEKDTLSFFSIEHQGKSFVDACIYRTKNSVRIVGQSEAHKNVLEIHLVQ